MPTELDRPLATDTLASLATNRAGASRVFLRHGLDFCCGGMVPLSEACAKKDLSADELIDAIVAEEREHPAPETWESRPIADLIAHILATFHEPHREELPRLSFMAKKVEAVHGDKPTCPKGLHAHLERMRMELEEHMQKEEQILFPAILGGAGAMVATPVSVMEAEHQDHGKNLEKLRQLATDFVPPEEACGTWRALYLGLAELEAEVMRHIHLENYVLFPMAVGS